MPHSILKRFLVAAALAGALSLTARAQALPEHGHPGFMPPHAGFEGRGGHERPDEPVPPFLRGVKLSEEQKDKIFAIMHAQMPQMRQLAKALRKAHEELRDLALSDKYDEARARTLAEGAAKASTEMALLRARGDQQIFALLPPEQRSCLDGKNCR